MTNSKDNSVKVDGRLHGLVLLESMSQFIGARLSSLLSPLTHRPGAANAIVRPNSFSSEIINKHDYLLAANVCEFLSGLFGSEFMAAEMTGFQGNLVYKEPGRRLQQVIHNSIEKSVLSLTINKLTQFFGTWLNHQYTVRMLSKLENNGLLPAHPHWPSLPLLQFSNQADQVEAAVFERHEGFRIVEKSLETLSAKDAASQRQPKEGREALSKFEKALQAVHTGKRGDRRAPGSNWQSFQAIQLGLKVHQSLRADASSRQRGTPPADLAPPPSQEFVFQQHHRTRESHDWTQTRNERGRETTQASHATTPPESMAVAYSVREMAEKIEDLYSIKQVTGSSPVHRVFLTTGPIGGGVDAYRSGPLSVGLPAVASERVNRAERPPGYSAPARRQVNQEGVPSWPRARRQVNQDSTPSWLNARRQVNQESVPSWPHALTTVEEWFEQKQGSLRSFPRVTTSFVRHADSVSLRATRIGEATEVTEDAFAPLAIRALAGSTLERGPLPEDQQNRVENHSTILRKEERMRPPLQNYAYVQPARETIEEERVVKRVHEREVVDLVRKEVETLMKSRSPITELSRSDYSRITDQVWSSLSRRLMMEKERLGQR